MGVVEGYENLSKITTKYGQRDIVHFRITDGRYINTSGILNIVGFVFICKFCI